jgi:iron-sulfur cluster assembly accessory protein
MKNLIKICCQTQDHFKRLIRSTNNSKILIGVKGGGCNGLKYYIEPINDKFIVSKYDEEIKIYDIDIVICGHSVIHLVGTEIKWKNDFMGSGIEFINPNAQTTCGCGETFSPSN